MERKALGKFGENYAAKYLKHKGYRICCRNFKCSLGEIDVVARKDQTIYFVEVKCRRDTTFGFPYEAVNRRKKHKIRQVAQYYLKQNKYNAQNMLFAVISILVNPQGNVTHVEMIEDDFFC